MSKNFFILTLHIIVFILEQLSNYVVYPLGVVALVLLLFIVV